MNENDECAYCGHPRYCHVIFKSLHNTTTQCIPTLKVGPVKINTKWLSPNWCGCQKFQEPDPINCDDHEDYSV